jgi:hypothetical protein
MNRLKLALSFTGLVLVIASLLLDMSLGRPAEGRIVGWIAIAVLMGAVGIRIVEKRRGGTGGKAERRTGGQDD